MDGIARSEEATHHLERSEATRPATPPPSPLDMKPQRFGVAPESGGVKPEPLDAGTVFARLVVACGTAAGATYGIQEISGVVASGGTTVLERALVVLFGITFAWIVFAAATAALGFVGGLVRGRGAIRIKDTQTYARTAILVPVYQEDPMEVGARIEAMARDLIEADEGHGFEFFVLSDTRDPGIWIEEEIAVSDVRRAIDDIMPVWYRRRPDNVGRKAGNIDDFVRNWGGRYDFMIVLDADSLITSETLVALRDDMEADPIAGLIQTAPRLIRGRTVLARTQQFANQVYGPVYAQGLAMWQGSEGNFWGHNAILRVKAFAESAGLPDLTGPPPFGGTVLSHDFVEAALLRRNGWSVRMRADLDGSYEETPPTLGTIMARDRRWMQGNFQHIRLVPAAGFTTISRIHLLTGILSFLTSPFWFLLILTGLALSIQAHFIRPEYFTEAASLFPMWPRFDTERMLSLFFVTLGVLFTPKILGLAQALIRLDRLSRLPRLLAGLIAETLFAALLAPIMMVVHTRQAISILSGTDSGWRAQSRRVDRRGSVAAAARLVLAPTMIGLMLGLTAIAMSLDIFLWLLPVLAGLVFATPLVLVADTAFLPEAREHERLVDEVLDPAGRRLLKRFGEALQPKNQQDRSATGLRLVLGDPAVGTLHNHFMQPAPRRRGNPDAATAMAMAKIEDATSQAELMNWLSKSEEVAILMTPDLLNKARDLPTRDPAFDPMHA
ncbi:MAG: glucans biosynthesis glucosyltransferase MdoH [Pseudomonadota bacterium]